MKTILCIMSIFLCTREFGLGILKSRRGAGLPPASFWEFMEGPTDSSASAVAGSELHSSPMCFRYSGSKSVKKLAPWLSKRNTFLMLGKQMRFAKKPSIALSKPLNTLSSGCSISESFSHFEDLRRTAKRWLQSWLITESISLSCPSCSSSFSFASY